MRVVNSKPSDPYIGKKVAVKKEYKSGTHHLNIGDFGTVIGMTLHSLPDFGLFDVKVYDIKFTAYTLSWGEGILKEYLNII